MAARRGTAAYIAVAGIALALLASAAAAAAEAAEEEASLACAARKEGESVVCVCNSTYCDNIVRSAPAKGRYVTYTSSKDGLRFDKAEGEIKTASASFFTQIFDEATETIGGVVLEVNTSSTYQSVEGFGAAVTDAAGINWLNLSTQAQGNLIQSYFSESGLQYNMLRVPIGGSDFSTHAYTYNELPVDDKLLSNFSLSEEDYLYKIPMLKAALAASPSQVQLVATTWSPPVWMKTNGKISGESRLKTEYYQTYADYHLKFLEKYAAEGIPVWGITTTNEPVNGVIPFAQFNSLGWTPAAQSQWITGNLGPTIRFSKFAATKILAVDDQRYTVPFWFHAMVAANASVLQYVDGVAVHYYGDIVPAALISWTHDHYPDKFILATEACEGSKPWQLEKVVLGSWTRAENYIKDIIQDLNHWVVGWMDWNLCLNASGGPNWSGNFVDSPVIVFAERDEFVKQPMFYAMGHFAKFVPRGSRRVDVSRRGWRALEHVAFLTPRGTLVLVLHNGGSRKSVEVVMDDKRRVTLQVPAKSITTLELQP